MLNKLIKYYNTTVFPWELLRIPSPSSSKKLKIGLCSYFPPFPHGVAAATYYLLKEFAKHPEIELYLIPLHNKFDKRLFSFMPIRFSKIQDTSLDVVIFLCLGIEYDTYAALVHGKKIAWQTMHEDPLTEKKPLTGPTEQDLLNQVKHADLVLAMTHFAYSCYKKQIPHVAYLPFGVNPNLFLPHQKKGQFTCLFVSRLNYSKGIISFLDSIPIILSQDPQILFKIVSVIDTHSLFADEIIIRLKEVKKKYPSQVVVYDSWIPYSEIPTTYATADVLVFPSNNEGFGIPLIEAMSCEVPCIVLDKKPMSEIIENNKTGYCLPASKHKEKYYDIAFPDPNEIAKKILFLKKHPEIMDKMRIQCRKRSIKDYNLLNVVNKLIEYCKITVQ